jgi:coenzyme F420-reducing hydrogenase alpha subunit
VDARVKENVIVKVEGGLQIALYRECNQVRKVDIRSQRPLQAMKIFHGKAIGDVLQTLPLLYHVCGVAQASAAVMACEQAMSIQVGEGNRQAREMLVWMETAREHLWRIMMDWTDKLGEEKDKTAIVQVQQFLPQLKQALFGDNNGFSPDAQVQVNVTAAQSVVEQLKQMLVDTVFAMPLERWLAFTDKLALQHWVGTVGTVAAKMLKRAAEMEQDNNLEAMCSYLPAMDESRLHQCLEHTDADNFVAQPLWQGKPCETTVLCRQYQHPLIADLLDSNGNGVMTRMVARLVELAGIPAALERLLRQLRTARPVRHPRLTEQCSGVGIGQVEAARGRLVHRLVIENGIVRRYQILAPTEWNFHPQGVAAQLLKCLPARDEAKLKQQADLLINTIDPCVHYQLTVH